MAGGEKEKRDGKTRNSRCDPEHERSTFSDLRDLDRDLRGSSLHADAGLAGLGVKAYGLAGESASSLSCLLFKEHARRLAKRKKGGKGALELTPLSLACCFVRVGRSSPVRWSGCWPHRKEESSAGGWWLCVSQTHLFLLSEAKREVVKQKVPSINQHPSTNSPNGKKVLSLAATASGSRMISGDIDRKLYTTA